MVEKIDHRLEKEHPTDEEISAFVSGFLGDDKLAQVAKHIATCENCGKIAREAADKNSETRGEKNEEETIH